MMGAMKDAFIDALRAPVKSPATLGMMIESYITVNGSVDISDLSAVAKKISKMFAIKVTRNELRDYFAYLKQQEDERAGDNRRE